MQHIEGSATMNSEAVERQVMTESEPESVFVLCLSEAGKLGSRDVPSSIYRLTSRRADLSTMSQGSASPIDVSEIAWSSSSVIS